MTTPAKPNPRRRKPAKRPKEQPLLTKIGRPLSYPDVEQMIKILGGLGSVMATRIECAAVLNISTETLHRMFERWPEVKDAYETGKESGKVSLRRNQFDLAKRNSTMAIFLGLNYLDQQDLRQVNLGGKVDHEHQHTVLQVMLKEIDQESRSRPLIEHDPTEVVPGPNEEAA